MSKSGQTANHHFPPFVLLPRCCPARRRTGSYRAGKRTGGKRPIADVGLSCQIAAMRNVQIIDGASNATYSLFQATDEEFAALFPGGRDMETIEDLTDRLGDEEVSRVLAPMWSRPVLKRDALGLHGTLFYDNERRQLPASKREVDWDERSINPAQRELFAHRRE